MTDPPRVTPSVLRAADECALRFHRLLAGGAVIVTGDQRRRFALANAIAQACRDAHARAEAEAQAMGEGGAAGGAVAEALADLPPPADLTPEERDALAHALATYGRLARERPARLDARAGQRFHARDSRTGRFTALAVIDLMVRRAPTHPPAAIAAAAAPAADPEATQDGVLEVRDLALQPAPEPPARSTRAILAALVLGAPLVHAHWDLRDGQVTETTFALEDVEALGASLQARVLATLDAATPPSPTPGRWCSGCPVLRSCPAVAHATAAVLRGGAP